LLNGVAITIAWEPLAQAILDFPHLTSCESWVLLWIQKKHDLGE
jgi:hypothetical protein